GFHRAPQAGLPDRDGVAGRLEQGLRGLRRRRDSPRRPDRPQGHGPLREGRLRRGERQGPRGEDQGTARREGITPSTRWLARPTDRQSVGRLISGGLETLSLPALTALPLPPP